MSTPELVAAAEAAVLDEAHVGDIRGALGTIRRTDLGPRSTWRARLATLLAILGPGLIVMVGDNDAGAFGTYTQAGQDFGTTLLWTLLLLVPVLYVNQEMVVRLGAVTRVGHARLILQRFGRFWGAFSVIDLFLLNALTIVTEFIGITLALGYLGLPRELGVLAAAGLIIGAAGTGDFRRFERLSMLLVAGSALLLPVLLWVHPPLTQVAHDLVVPRLPHGGTAGERVLLMVAIVGTTVAPWQLFFQQSYLVDKRITPRFLRYARTDLWLGIVLVIVGAVAMIAFAAGLFAHRPEAGHFLDAGAVAAALGQYVSRAAGVCFALALIDASLIGAMAVSLSSAYALGDLFAVRHSLHRKPAEARGFYAVYAALVLLAAGLVLIPGMPLGLMTNAVQALAGVLLPSATVFLLLLCNDRALLGPYVNGKGRNLLTGAIITGLVLLSMVLTVAVVFPGQLRRRLVELAVGAVVLGAFAAAAALVRRVRRTGGDRTEPGSSRVPSSEPGVAKTNDAEWRVPVLETLQPLDMRGAKGLWMVVLRGYLILAAGVVLLRIVRLAVGGP